MTGEERKGLGDPQTQPGEGEAGEQYEPNIDLEWGKNMEAILKVACPKCSRTTRVKFRDAAPGHVVECPCGEYKLTLDGDDLRDLQRSVDGFRRTFNNLFK